MPKIAEIEPTPNPNAMKFILKEPLTWGITRSYDNAAQAESDPLASALFDIEHVTNVFYVDHWITVTQDGQADWQGVLRGVAGPLPQRARGRRSVATTRRTVCQPAGDGADERSRSRTPRKDQRHTRRAGAA